MKLVVDKLYISKFLQVFVSTALMDLLWALYFRFVSAENVIGASLVSASLVGTSLFTFISVDRSKRLILAAMLGAVYGTYIALSF